MDARLHSTVTVHTEVPGSWFQGEAATTHAPLFIGMRAHGHGSCAITMGLRASSNVLAFGIEVLYYFRGGNQHSHFACQVYGAALISKEFQNSSSDLFPRVIPTNAALSLDLLVMMKLRHKWR